MSSTNRKIVAVVGATGAQGSSVVQTFSSNPEYHVRALTRSTTSDRAKTLLANYPDIELVTADLDDISTLKAAFKNASVIFANTDFWSICIPANADKPAPGQPLNEWAYEQEIQQGKNILDAAANVPSLERLVYSNLADVKKWSGGKYEYVLHFQSKAEIVKYGQATYPDLYAKTSLCQLGFYLENWLGHPWMSPKKAEDGVVEFENSFSTDPVLPLVATKQDTGPIVAELVKQPAGKHVIVHRARMPFSTFVERWSKVTGKEARLVKAKPLPVPPELKRELDETFKFLIEFGYWGHEDTSVVLPEQLAPQLNFGTVEEWIREQSWGELIA